MSAPIIPADQWPEGADRHCWDANGLGFFHVPTTEGAQMWLLVLKQSHIPLPAGWDWRVPVMRPSAEPAPVIDLAQVRASVQSLLNWIDDWAETPGESGIEAIAEEAEAVLALIDGQEDDSFPCCGGNDETPREHCMDCPDFLGQPSEGEGE